MTLFSQTQVLIGVDTNVCFTKDKASYLLSTKIKLNETAQLLNVANMRVDTMTKAYNKMKEAKEKADKEVSNKTEESQIKDHKLDEKDIEITSLKSDVLKQKTLKWVAIAGAALIETVQIFFYVKLHVLP